MLSKITKFNFVLHQGDTNTKLINNDGFQWHKMRILKPTS